MSAITRLRKRESDFAYSFTKAALNNTDNDYFTDPKDKLEKLNEAFKDENWTYKYEALQSIWGSVKDVYPEIPYAFFIGKVGTLQKICSEWLSVHTVLEDIIAMLLSSIKTDDQEMTDALTAFSVSLQGRFKNGCVEGFTQKSAEVIISKVEEAVNTFDIAAEEKEIIQEKIKDANALIFLQLPE